MLKVRQFLFKKQAGLNSFDPKALNIEDGTEITGQFQTEKYQGIDFSKSVGVHLRLGDILSDPYWRSRYYVPSVEYYRKALSMFQHRETILVFSDQAELAKKYLSNLKFDIMYIEAELSGKSF